MTCKRPIDEHILIDLIQEHYDCDDQQILLEHITTCEDCKKKFEMWKNLLQPMPEDQPRANVKRKVFHALRKNNGSGKINRKSAIVLMSVSIACTIGYLMFLSPSKLQNDIFDQPLDSLEEESLQQPFLLKEDTNIYEIAPEFNQQIQGYVWINTQSNEMMLLIDGLQPISYNDYQAWIQTKNELKNAGVMKLFGHKGQLYMKDFNIDEFKHIVVSKEPLGGSPFLTDPNPVMIQLSTH